MVLDPTNSNHIDYGTIHPSPDYPVQRNTNAFLTAHSNQELCEEEELASSRMTQGDLYQRQPLLPTPTKGDKWNSHNHNSTTKEYYDEDEDDVDDISRNSVTNCNGIIKINVPPPVREEPKYPKEKWKTLFGEHFIFVNLVEIYNLHLQIHQSLAHSKPHSIPLYAEA